MMREKVKHLEGLYPVNVEEQRIAGVRVDVVTPKEGAGARLRVLDIRPSCQISNFPASSTRAELGKNSLARPSCTRFHEEPLFIRGQESSISLTHPFGCIRSF